MRLRNEKLVARQLHVKIKYLDAPSWREFCYCDDVDDSHTLLLHLNQLLALRPKHSKPFAVLVVLSNLCERIGTTDDLFAHNSDHTVLSSVMDIINQRFGFQKICYASSQKTSQSAPMRIAFTRIPDVAREDELFKRV
jgi:DNA polymerase IV